MGESRIGHSCGARPRSAVSVSLHLPALARLTRSVRVVGRVDPSLSDGSSGQRMHHFVTFGATSLGFTARDTLCLTFLCAPGTSSSRVLVKKDPAHSVPRVGHGSYQSNLHTRPKKGRNRGSDRVGCHEE